MIRRPGDPGYEPTILQRLLVQAPDLAVAVLSGSKSRASAERELQRRQRAQKRQ